MSNNRILEVDYSTAPNDGEVPTFDAATNTWKPAAGGGGGGGGGITTEEAQDAIGTILVDSSEIDFTYNDATPSITATLKNGSIDEARLDASVNASLDLADSALQASAIGTTVQAYSAVLAATTASFTTTDETKLDAMSGSELAQAAVLARISIGF
jgi:hypothetical protein